MADPAEHGISEEADARQKLQDMLEAQKAQDPNFAKLTGNSNTYP